MATVVKDLGAVTAYAYAVAGGYSGTEAEFEALLGNIAEDLSEIENLSVTVTTLPAGSSATASYNNGVLSLGIPKGDKGDKGDTGATGATGPQGIPGDVANLASAYSTSSTYGVGDYCIYNSQLYRCTTPITTAEAWTAAHWAAAVLGDDIGDLKSALVKAEYLSIINGADTTWENKLVDRSGNIVGSNYNILSNFIEIADFGKPFSTLFTGAVMADATPVYVYVAQYSGNNATDFISRDLLYFDGDYSRIKLNSGCKYVRFIYGHTNSSGVQMPLSNVQYFSALLFVDFLNELSNVNNALSGEIGSVNNTAEDSYSAIYGNLIYDANETPLSIGVQINSNDGGTTSSNYYDATDYIDLNSANTIRYPSPATSLTSVIAGTAFYNADKTYISGVSIITGGASKSTQYRTLKVPEGAKYVRISYWNESFAEQEHIPYPTFTVRDASESIDVRLDTVEAELSGSMRQEVAALGLHSIPQNQGVLNVIKRCRQMTDIRWTPVIDLPRLNSVSGNFEDDPLVVYQGAFKAGVEYTGLPYGRTYQIVSGFNYTYLYIGLDVGFDTFISSVCNQDSMLCKTSQYDAVNHRSIKYAVVCSALSSYAYNWPFTTTENTPSITGVSKVSDIINNGTRMDLSLIKLGDMVLKPTWHIGVVTDIVTDASGNVTVIEVSEATTFGNGNQDISGGPDGGICRRKGWDVEDFFDTWGTFGIYRYSGIANVPYTPQKYVAVGNEPDMMRYNEFPCMPYMGNGFKYKSGYIPNTDILISCNNYDYLRVFKDGTEITGSPFALSADMKKVSVGFSDAGDYTAYLCNMSGGNDTVRTQKSYWSVVS